MAAITVNRKPIMRDFTGKIADLQALMYRLRNDIAAMQVPPEYEQFRSQADRVKLDNLNAEYAYVYRMYGLPGNGDYADDASGCGLNTVNTDTINFPDWNSPEYLAQNAATATAEDAAAKETAQLNFKMNIRNLFFAYVASSSHGGPDAAALTFTQYQYQWNLFEQRNLGNIIADRIIYPITSFDAAYNIPSNPEAYNPREVGLGYEDYQALDNPDTASNVGATINPYVNPDTYVFQGGGLLPDTGLGINKCGWGFHQLPNGSCEPDSALDPLPCPTGQHRDGNGNCVADTIQPCPTGQHKDAVGNCVADTPVVTPCGIGFYKDSAGNCVPNGIIKGNDIIIFGIAIKPIYLAVAGVALLLLLTRNSK